MWAAIVQVVLSAGAVWIIAALASKLARKSAALEQAEKEALEREKVDSIIRNNSDLQRDECLERLRGGADKK
uniref:Uncharacterized protein n=1 Tax=uncultured Elusimicrobia bacterium TaxID=699876 RepID=A0A650EM23_9BACT|nr:hypothetical protein Elusimicrob1349_1260 [uncultured Elusimicrobia bacterium]